MAERAASLLRVIELLEHGDSRRRPIRLAYPSPVQQRDQCVAAMRNVGECCSRRILERAERDPQQGFIRFCPNEPVASHSDCRPGHAGTRITVIRLHAVHPYRRSDGATLAWASVPE